MPTCISPASSTIHRLWPCPAAAIQSAISPGLSYRLESSPSKIKVSQTRRRSFLRSSSTSFKSTLLKKKKESPAVVERERDIYHALYNTIPPLETFLLSQDCVRGRKKKKKNTKQTSGGRYYGNQLCLLSVVYPHRSHQIKAIITLYVNYIRWLPSNSVTELVCIHIYTVMMMMTMIYVQ